MSREQCLIVEFKISLDLRLWKSKGYLEPGQTRALGRHTLSMHLPYHCRSESGQGWPQGLKISKLVFFLFCIDDEHPLSNKLYAVQLHKLYQQSIDGWCIFFFFFFNSRDVVTRRYPKGQMPITQNRLIYEEYKQQSSYKPFLFLIKNIISDKRLQNKVLKIPQKGRLST